MSFISISFCVTRVQWMVLGTSGPPGACAHPPAVVVIANVPAHASSPRTVENLATALQNKQNTATLLSAQVSYWFRFSDVEKIAKWYYLNIQILGLFFNNKLQLNFLYDMNQLDEEVSIIARMSCHGFIRPLMALPSSQTATAVAAFYSDSSE